MTNEEAEGTTEQTACRFWITNCTVTRRPFQSAVALAMSSPTFLGDYGKFDTIGKREQGREGESATIFPSSTALMCCS